MSAKIKILKTYPVTGLSCASCASRTESFVKTLPGVANATVNFADSSLLVEYVPAEISASDMKKSVQSIGYDIIIDEENSELLREEAHNAFLKKIKINTLGAALLSIPLVIIAMVFMDIKYSNYIMFILAAPVVFWFGRQFFSGAWKQLRHRSANMDTLVALSTGIAFIYSSVVTFFPALLHNSGIHGHVYFEASAVIITFILLGKLLEERAKSNTSSAIKKLIGLQPQTVILVVSDDEQKEVPVNRIRPGDILLVRPGSKIPLDGTVTSGGSFVDESMISGEPMAVEKYVNSKVYAGTINQRGSFRFRADKSVGNTVLAQIIRMVKEAQGSKAPIQHLVDKISSIFVPVVLIVAFVSGLIWYFSGVENAITHSLLAVVTVLIIACPCALGLATPTAIMVGIGKGASNGILIKDAESLEIAHKVNAVVLDKTGTVTIGEPAIDEIQWSRGTDTDSAGSILLSVQKNSEHPLAAPLVTYLEKSGFNGALQIKNLESITGKGIRAVVNDKVYYVGNWRLMEENNIKKDTYINGLAEKWQNEAKTVYFFADSVSILAVVAVSDKIKASSVEAVKQLYSMGIEVYLLTGDNEQTARSIADQAGIRNYKAEVLPDAKYNFIKELQGQGKVVAMAGDGINDSQALAQADVSIAMGKGSDIAIDVARMTVISSDLLKIPQAIQLSKYTVRTIRQNLFWAFVYNLITIPLAAGILYPVSGFLINPMIAGATMALSSVSVVSNSLRLRFKKI